MSANDVNQYVNNCVDSSLKCALYTKGLNIKQQSLDDIKAESQDYIKKSLNLCLGDLSQKFRGNKFNFDKNNPEIIFSEDATSVSIKNLGEMTNGGNVRKTLGGYAAKTQIAFSKVYAFIQSIKNNQREKRIENIDPRFKLSVYQLDDTKEAIIVSDALSKFDGKEFKAVYTN